MIEFTCVHAGCEDNLIGAGLSLLTKHSVDDQKLSSFQAEPLHQPAPSHPCESFGSLTPILAHACLAYSQEELLHAVERTL
jgi:hypothetical protein